MFRKYFVVLILILLIGQLTGCWDAVDVNSKALCTVFAVDKQGDDYCFYVEVPNLAMSQGPEGGDGKGQYQWLSGRGKTFAEARQMLDFKMDKPIFLGTVRTLVLTKSMVEQGIEEYMFRAQNLTDYRKAVGVVSTNEKLEDLLSAEPENNVSVGFSIEETVNSSEQEGNLVFYSTTNVLDFLYRGSCFVIINIDFVDDKLAITGYSIIHEGKYLDFIPVEESKGLVWLLADQPSWIYVVTMDNVDVTLEVKLKSRKIEPVYADGKMTLNIDFEFEATQMYLSKDIVMDEYKESKIIDLLEIRILQDIEDTIRKSRSNQCEYLQFKEIFRVKYPNILKRVDWLQTYMESEINISTKVDSKAGVMMDFEAVGKLPKG